jgi:hypothetical protein
MWGEKDRQIAGLEETVREQRGELDIVRPYAGIAREIYDTVGRLSMSGPINDPSSLPEGLYDQAVEAVSEGYRRDIIQSAAAALRLRKGIEIRQKVEETEGDTLRAKEESRFVEEDELAFRAETERAARKEIVVAHRRDLKERRPREISEAYAAEHGDQIRADEEERFRREDEETFRKKAASEARKSLTGTKLEELRAAIREEEGAKVRALVEDEERFKFRVDQITEKARRTRKVKLTDLLPDDVLIVKLTDGFADDADLNKSKSERSLKLSIASPLQGTAHVMGDTWERGSALERFNALNSGSLIAIDTALGVSAGNGEQVTGSDPTADFAITYSMPLRVTRGGQDLTIDTFDVSKVEIETSEGTKSLLGPKGNQSDGFRSFNNW